MTSTVKLGISFCSILFVFSTCMAGQSVDEIRSKARQGDANAQYNLGLKYYEGRGVPKNNEKAMQWYQKAAEQGHVKAQYQLGWMYDYEVEVPGEEEAEKASKKFEATNKPSDARNSLKATINLMRNFNRINDEAIKWYKKAAEHGHADAQYELGGKYAIGSGGRKEDCAQAAKWWEKAAAQGHSLAQLELGWLYHRGEGVPQNHVEAVKWWQKASEQGEPEALYKLGVMHYEGQGTPQNIANAYPYLSVAALLNIKNAKELLPKSENELTPAQIAQGKREAEILLKKVLSRYPGYKNEIIKNTAN